MVNLHELIDLKVDFSQLTQPDQVKYLAFFLVHKTTKTSFSVQDVRSAFIDNDLPPPANISREFTKLCEQDIFIKNKEYALHRDVQKSLQDEFFGSPTKRTTTNTLKDLAGKIKGTEQKAFLQEALVCFQAGAYRSAVIMVWLLTVDILFEHILSKQLADFNSAMTRDTKHKNKKITKKDDFVEGIKEGEFIALAKSAGVISSDIRKILDEKLGIRNTCAHPNSTVIKETKCAAVIEDLVDNVIVKYQ